MQVIGTAGHVDHGKSALVERLTGIDPDRFAEEKQRGMTIDLGFAWMELPSGREAGIVDVPGHERFIRNMLAGAGSIGVCLFVVAANEGWMPQSAEHLTAIDTLGVERGVVALTKCDLVDAARLAAVRAEIEARLAPSSLAGAPVVACSSVTGEGIEELRAALDALLDDAPAADGNRPRLWVDRVFTIAGAGTVVTGTLTGGALEAGAEVEVAPEGRRARIRSIQSHKRSVTRLEPGNRCALNLVGLERTGARRGDAIVQPGRWPAARRADAWVRVAPTELSGLKTPLRERGAYLLYVGSAEVPVRVRLLGAPLLEPGTEGPAQLLLQEPLPLRRGDRFVLRDAGRIQTIGGGEVLDPLAPAARRNDPGRAHLLERLQRVAPEDALRALVADAGEIERAEALARSGAPSVPDDVVVLGDRLVSEERLAWLAEQARATLARHHADKPLEAGMQAAALRAALGLDEAAFEGLLERSEGIRRAGASVALTTHEVRLDPAQAEARAGLLERIEGAGFAPPPARELGADPALVRSLVAAGELVAVGDFYLTAQGARRARSLVRDAIEKEGPVTVARIRDVLGTTRRYAVPLCEWLDMTGATLRRGDVRILGPRP